MTRLLVTGSQGQLGRALLRLAAERGVEAVGHDLDTLDITDPAAVLAETVRVRPTVLVNCAAYTAVDRCEEDEAAATAVNGTAVGHLAGAAARLDARLVHVSTDYVFDGRAASPYREHDPVAPASAYGRSKLVGEELALRSPCNLVVRTAWLYGLGGSNFVEAIRRQVEAGTAELRVVADQHGCPTFCDDLAAALLELATGDAAGVVHAVNSGTTTWHGFAEEIVRQLGATTSVRAVTTAEFPRPAPRPAYSVLDTSRLTALLGQPLPPWQDGLRRYLERTCGS